MPRSWGTLFGRSSPSKQNQPRGETLGASTTGRPSAKLGETLEDHTKIKEYGITVTHDAGTDAALDIVFVHGLTGKAHKTWLHKSSGVHWPRDLLKLDIQDCRILVYGYDADVANFLSLAGKGNLSNHAEDLLGELVRLRERSDTEKRRIVFVAHSLGGLVVEAALNFSSNNVESHLRQVEKYTSGIAFLGTPQLGSSLASHAKSGAYLLNMARATNHEIIGILKPGSEVLRIVQRDFHSLLRMRADAHDPIAVTSFFEELPVLGVGEIVSQQSAWVKGYNQYPIHANHMDMTKFPSRDDKGYDSILGEILRWKKQLKGGPGLFPPYRTSDLNGKHYVKRTGLFDAIASAFRVTEDVAESRVVLLSGLAGSGKTHLARGFAQVWVGLDRPAYWIDASSEEALIRSFLTFALHTRLLTTQELSVVVPEEVCNRIVDFLTKFQTSWLLIMDNYDTFHGANGFPISKYLPIQGHGNILITSRNAGARKMIFQSCHVISIDSMNEDEACELFCNFAHIERSYLTDQQRSLIAEIVTSLATGLPLAIAQAAAYVKNIVVGETSLQTRLQEYIGRFRTHQNTILDGIDGALVHDYGRSVLTTFDMSFENIQQQKRNKGAASLLLLCGFFHHSDIQIKWFERAFLARKRFEKSGINLAMPCYRWFNDYISENAQGDWDSFELGSALRILTDYALVRQGLHATSWNIHPLVHSCSLVFARNRPEDDVEIQARLAAAILVETYDRSANPGLAEARISKLQLYPHINSWLFAATRHTSLLNSRATTMMQPYTLQKLAGFLDGPLLSIHHKSLHTVIRLRILALSNSASLKQFDRVSALDALTSIVSWLDTNIMFPTNHADIVLLMIDSHFDKAATYDPEDARVVLDHACNFLTRAAVLVSSSLKVASSIVVMGTNFVKEHSVQMKAGDRLWIDAHLTSGLASFSESDTQRDQASSRLQEIALESDFVLGQDHYISTEIRFLAQSTRKRMLLTPSTNEEAKEYQKLSGTGDPTMLNRRRIWLLQEALAEADKNGLQGNSRLLELHEERREMETELYGRWHEKTLRIELEIQLQRVFLAHSENRMVGLSTTGIDRWKGREDVLILPIEAAIGFKTFGQEDCIDPMWNGVLQEIKVAAHTLKVSQDIEAALHDAAEAARFQGYESSAEIVDQAAHHVRKAIRDRTSARGESLEKSFVRLSRVWKLLDKVGVALANFDTEAQEKLELDLLTLVQEAPPLPRQSVLYLILKYTVWMMLNEEALQSRVIFSMNTVSALDVHFRTSFTENGGIFYRWQVVIAVSARVGDDGLEATNAEELLLHRALEDVRLAVPSGAEATKDDPAPELVRITKTRMDEISQSIPWGKFCLEDLDVQYDRRGWFEHRIRLYQKALSAQVQVQGLAAGTTLPPLMLMSSACEKAKSYGQLEMVLQEFEKVLGHGEDLVVDFGDRVLREVTAKLARARAFRAPIVILDWLLICLQTHVSKESFSTTAACLMLQWAICSQKRMCYYRLKLPYNAHELASCMQELERRIPEQVEEHEQQELRKQFEIEQAFWVMLQEDSAGQ